MNHSHDKELKEIEEIKLRLKSGAYNDDEVLLFNRRLDKLQRHLGNEPRQTKNKEADDAVAMLLSKPIPSDNKHIIEKPKDGGRADNPGDNKDDGGRNR